MARQLEGIEIGIHLLTKNGDTGVAILFGSPAPGGETFTDAAELSSTYMRTNGEFYLKDVTGTGVDKWVKMATIDDVTNINWRPQIVRALTGDAAPISGAVINLVTNPFGDDASPTLVAADFSVDEYILFGDGGTPKLMRVSVVASPNITIVDVSDPIVPLRDNDAFLVRNYLPDDPDDQEKQALILYNGTDFIKIGDVNWDVATGINLSSAYTPGTGNITSADTVEQAIQKLDGNVDNLTAAVGISQGDLNMGVYTGLILNDNETAKQNFQQLADFIEDLNGGDTVRNSTTGVTTEVVLDEVDLNDVIGSTWQVAFHDAADQTKRKIVHIFSGHDGTPSVDATQADDSVGHVIKPAGNPVGAEIRADISGSGSSQKLQLLAKSTGNAMDFYSTRTDVRY